MFLFFHLQVVLFSKTLASLLQFLHRRRHHGSLQKQILRLRMEPANSGFASFDVSSPDPASNLSNTAAKSLTRITIL
ncbi:hypothetical protein COLO4_36428 [Corchorus olitorius]|uniref:Secreted protein n=1 Tax=Corchorus olitorius TaxID=93759 RepID=A0A1R3G8X6_9ROSI|nr:hypothetical protein COLO4_36428 [Corchorus olitorius]